MTTQINNENKKLNFSNEREQSQACLNSAEHEKNQGRKVLNVPNKREQNQTCLDSAEREGLRPKGNVPNLRFPEFEGEWEEERLADIADLYKGTGISKDQLSDDGEPCILYGELYTKYKSETIREVISKTNIDNTKLVRSKANDVIIPCSGETAEDIATARCVLNGNILLGGDLNIIRLHGYDGAFMSYQLNGKRKYDIAKVAQGVSVVHLYGEHLKGVKTINPCLEEQKKIASLLALLDERISTQSKIIDKLQSLIKGIRNDVFGKLRKSVGFNAMISDVLSYEQPQPYIVENTEYTAEGTPVLTANKAFVLGYTSETNGIYDKGDCIIFDDFTLDCKYVDFPYKIKSSAIKILTAKNKEILRYTFEFLKYLDLSTDEHKRHYIAETQNQEFVLPTMQIVRTIAHAFSALSLRMESVVKQRNMFETQKQYLLRQMFI